MSIDPVVEVWEEPITVTIVENSPDITSSDSIVEVSIVEGDATEIVVAADTVVNVIDEPVEVIVDAYADPIVNVYLGGIGGLPGAGSGDYQWFDVAAFVQTLNGSITKGQLSIDLSTQIDESTTGITQANEDLAAAILNYEAGMQAIDAHDTRITTAETNINLHASRLNVTEGLIQTANVDITDLAIRTTVAEGAIGSQEARLVAQEEITSNEWTVKIQENVDGSAYAAGVGLLVYPEWLSGMTYAVDDFVFHNDVVYKATAAHVSSLANEPPNTNFWVNIPYGVKSQFGVLADSFFVQAPGGDKKVPFLVQNGLVTIDGDLMASGTITASALVAHDVVSWTMQSFNYAAGVSGWKIDAINNWAEFNDITMSWNALDNKPTSLAGINSAEGAKLTGIAEGATVGAPTGTYVGGMAASSVATWANDPATRVNANTTTISGGKITTNTLVAEHIKSNEINQIYWIRETNSRDTEINVNFPTLSGSTSETIKVFILATAGINNFGGHDLDRITGGVSTRLATETSPPGTWLAFTWVGTVAANTTHTIRLSNIADDPDFTTSLYIVGIKR